MVIRPHMHYYSAMPMLAALNEDKPFAVVNYDDQRLINVPHFRAKGTRALVPFPVEGFRVFMQPFDVGVVRLHASDIPSSFVS
jgi:hypothetical protein